MKGLHGLILAIGLGIAGALFNFAYLANRARDVEKIAFVGIAPQVTVNRGERLTEEHLVPVDIPSMSKGNLEDYGILWSAKNTVVGQRVWRTMTGGTLLLRQDLKTPPRELTFGQGLKPGTDERAVGVPIDPRKIVPSLINPGDLVTFVAPGNPVDNPRLAPITAAKTDRAKPEPGKVEPIPVAGAADPPRPADALDMIGPFKVLSLGNRLSSPEVMQASQGTQAQESVMLILVRLENGRLEPQADRLLKLIQVNNSQPLVVMLHPRPPKVE